MSGKSFFPWHTSFGRTVATDVLLDAGTMLRSVVVYEEARGNSMLLRVEVLHGDERHPVEVDVDGVAAKRMGASDDGFRAVADFWFAPAPDNFSVVVAYGNVKAGTTLTL
jgi:hypothetical protein